MLGMGEVEPRSLPERKGHRLRAFLQYEVARICAREQICRNRSRHIRLKTVTMKRGAFIAQLEWNRGSQPFVSWRRKAFIFKEGK